jgi:hypothetical protein
MEKLKQTIEKIKSGSKKADMLAEALEAFNDLTEAIEEAVQKQQKEEQEQVSANKKVEQPQTNFKERLVTIAPIKKVLKKAHILNLEEDLCDSLKKDWEEHKKGNYSEPLCIGFVETEEDSVGLITAGLRSLIVAKYGEPQVRFKQFLKELEIPSKPVSGEKIEKEVAEDKVMEDKDVECLIKSCSEYIDNLNDIKCLPLDFIENVYSSDDIKKEAKNIIGTILFLNMLNEGDVKVQYDGVDFTAEQAATLLSNNIDLKDMSIVSKYSDNVTYFKNGILTAIGKREQMLKVLSALIYVSNEFTSTKEMFKMLKKHKNTMFTQMLKLAKMPRESLVSLTEDINKEDSLLIEMIMTLKNK